MKKLLMVTLTVLSVLSTANAYQIKSSGVSAVDCEYFMGSVGLDEGQAASFCVAESDLDREAKLSCFEALYLFDMNSLEVSLEMCR